MITFAKSFKFLKTLETGGNGPPYPAVRVEVAGEVRVENLLKTILKNPLVTLNKSGDKVDRSENLRSLESAFKQA